MEYRGGKGSKMEENMRMDFMDGLLEIYIVQFCKVSVKDYNP